MAITKEIQPGGSKAKRWIVTFADDADTSIDIQHGFGATPDNYYFTPLSPQVYVGQVCVSATDDDKITLTKNTAVGSGGAIVELWVFVPTSSL